MGKAKPKNWVVGRWMIESMEQWRGWMVLDGENLKGMLFIHLGDDSGIVLKRAPERKFRKRK